MEQNKEINPKGVYNSRLINASPEKVFSAFAKAKHLQNWWGPKGFKNTFYEFNFIIGGVWDFIMHSPDGTDYKNKCVFLEIDKPNKIVIEHIPLPHFVLTVTLEEENGKARINWEQVFDSVEQRNSLADFIKNANEENFDRLESVIALI